MATQLVSTQAEDKKGRWCLWNGDCIDVIKGIPSESVYFSIFSPPFSSLFSYNSSERDLGNSRTYKEFFQHFDFLVEELERVMVPGRIIAVHSMDLPIFKRDEEWGGQRDFPGEIIRCFKKHGFIYHSKVCIFKDPLIAATRTHALNLAHKQIVKDSTLCGNGIADYITAFRKKGVNPKPVSNKMGLTEYHGSLSIPFNLERFVGCDVPKENKRSQWIWQKYASPVWMDIRQTLVLPFRKAKEADDLAHPCPLQLDVIERCLALWSTKDDVVFSPFAGVGSEIYVAVKNGRKGLGIELKRSYFRQAVRNLETLAKTKT